MRRLTITGVVAVSLLAAGVTAPASGAAARPSCATLARGAPLELVTPDGRMFSRSSRFGSTFYYGCANAQPHTRFLGSTRDDDPFFAQSLSGGFAAYTTAENLVEVKDLVHGTRIFVRQRPPDQDAPNGYTVSTSIGEGDALVNRFGRVAWFETVYHQPDPRSVQHPSQDVLVMLHDRLGTSQIGAPYSPGGLPNVCCLSLGLKSVSWREDPQHPLHRTLVY
jgi:hypothetical protein